MFALSLRFKGRYRTPPLVLWTDSSALGIQNKPFRTGFIGMGDVLLLQADSCICFFRNTPIISLYYSIIINYYENNLYFSF